MSQDHQKSIDIVQENVQNIQNAQLMEQKKRDKSKESIQLENHKDAKSHVEIIQIEKQTTKSKINLKATGPRPSNWKRTRRIIMYKCKICKTTGKKATVVMCTKCKFHFHKECLDPSTNCQNEKTFVCQLCDGRDPLKIKARYQPMKIEVKNVDSSIELKKNSSTKSASVAPSISNHLASQKKDDTSLQRQRFSTGFLNVSKLINVYSGNFRKQEWRRRLYQFYKKYPYCFQNKKVVFPIEDHLLHIYQTLFPSYCKTTTPRPYPKVEYYDAPKHFYNDLFEIQVFFNHFWEDMKACNFYKPKGQLQTTQLKLSYFFRKNFYFNMQPEGMNTFFVNVYEVFLRFYLTDILERTRIENMKYLSSNAFFNLLASINQFQGGLSKNLIVKCSPQIIKNISKIPSFRRTFLDQSDDKQFHQLTFPKKLTIDTKMNLIIKLLRGLIDVDCFKQIVMKKSQQISVYTKQKGQTSAQLKNLQVQNLTLKQQIKNFQQQIKNMSNSDINPSKKVQAHKKKLQKLQQTKKKNDQKIQQLKQNLKKIAKKSSFVNSLVRYLGVDRYGSEYFFYSKQRNKIYINYKEYMCLEQTQKDDTMRFYQTKQEVEQLKEWLNAKGVHQKALLANIAHLEQKQILFDDDKQMWLQKTQEKLQQIRHVQLESIKIQECLQILIFCQNLYKQTIKDKDSLPQRQKQMQALYYRINFQGNKQKPPSSKQNEPNTQQKPQQPLWKQYFSKYSIKIWNWNQKIKKFWFQFLQIFIKDPHYQTQGYLLILCTVFKITIKYYHQQILKKRQKIARRKQKQRLQRQKELQLYNQQFGGLSSEEQKNESVNNQLSAEPGKRLLRKRETQSIQEEKDEDVTPEQDEQYNTESKKSSSNDDNNIKTSATKSSKNQNKQVARSQASSKKNKNREQKQNKQIEVVAKSAKRIQNLKSKKQSKQEISENNKVETNNKQKKSQKLIQQVQKPQKPQKKPSKKKSNNKQKPTKQSSKSKQKNQPKSSSSSSSQPIKQVKKPHKKKLSLQSESQSLQQPQSSQKVQSQNSQQQQYEQQEQYNSQEQQHAKQSKNQPSQKQIQLQNENENQDQDQDDDQNEQLSPEQQFCQQCFQNVFYDKTSKVKIVRCMECPKIYHKKCLEEDDIARFKREQDAWKCSQCANKKYNNKGISSKVVKNVVLMGSGQSNIKGNNKFSLSKMMEQSINSMNSETDKKSKQLKQLLDDKPKTKSSKVQQKKDKKQMKSNKVQEERKIQQQTKIVEEQRKVQQSSQAYGYQQESKIEQSQSKSQKKSKKSSNKKQKSQTKDSSHDDQLPATTKTPSSKKQKKSTSKNKLQSFQPTTNISQKRITRVNNKKKKSLNQSSEGSFQEDSDYSNSI